MDNSVGIPGYQTCFDHAFDMNRIPFYRDGHEMHWECPAPLGRGFMYMVKLRQDLALAIGDCCFTRPLAFSYDISHSPVILGYSLDGTVDTILDTPSGPLPAAPQNRLTYLKQGCCVLSYLPRWKGMTRYTIKARVRGVQVLMTRNLFTSLLACPAYCFPGEMAATLAVCQAFCQNRVMTPQIRGVLDQILDCPLKGRLRQTYYQSKALELVSLSLLGFTEQPFDRLPPTGLSSREMACVSEARDLVARQFHDPPGLQELAKTVGLQHTRLNKCFRKAFGTTIFSYVRDLRLNQAKTLLETGDMNVTQAAFEVGYTSLSHFSKAFKSRFGTHPRALMPRRQG